MALPYCKSPHESTTTRGVQRPLSSPGRLDGTSMSLASFESGTRGDRWSSQSPSWSDVRRTSMAPATSEQAIRGYKWTLHSPNLSDGRNNSTIPAISEETMRGFKWTLQHSGWSNARKKKSMSATREPLIRSSQRSLEFPSWFDVKNTSTSPGKLLPNTSTSPAYERSSYGDQKKMRSPVRLDFKSTNLELGSECQRPLNSPFRLDIKNINLKLGSEGVRLLKSPVRLDLKIINLELDVEEDSASGSLYSSSVTQSPSSCSMDSPMSCDSDSSGVSSLEHSQPEKQWHESKTEIMYQGRDILDLASNMRGYFSFQFAHLPRRNVKMFLANRSQYDRLTWEDSPTFYDEVECPACSFKFIRPDGDCI